MTQESPEITKAPLVSVIIITYNQEKYLKQTVDSILEQDCNFDFEIIIGEDCSTDATRKICIALQKEHPKNIRLLLQDQNQGLTKNYLSTLALCRGKFIAQIAGDDYWNNPLKLQKQFDILEQHPELGLVYTDVDFYYEHENKTEKAVFKNNLKKRASGFEDHLLNKGFIAPMTWLYRKEISPTTFNYTKDYTDESFPFILDVYKNSKIYYLNEVTAVRRVIKDSASHQTNEEKKYKYMRGVFDIQKEYIEKYECSESFRNEVLSSNYIDLLTIAIKLKDENFIKETKSFFKNQNLSFESLERMSKKIIYLEKKSSNKVNSLYQKLRKKF